MGQLKAEKMHNIATGNLNVRNSHLGLKIKLYGESGFSFKVNNSRKSRVEKGG